MKALDETQEQFNVRVITGKGEEFIANLGFGYDEERTRMELYGVGIVVLHPEKPPIYINGTTKQISRDPEICRTALILNPEYQDLDIRKRS